MNNNRLRWTSIAEFLEEIKNYNQIAGIAEIARRYFAMNAFDGVLTTIGVLAGNYLAGVRDLSIPIRTRHCHIYCHGDLGFMGRIPD